MPLISKRSDVDLSDTRSLYDTDVVLWADTQVRALRARRLAELDFEHLAEEIEDLSAAAKRELRSRTRTLVEHLLKLRDSRASDPRLGWIETIERTRVEVRDLLAEAPSLRQLLPEVLNKVRDDALTLAIRSFDRAGETDAAIECRAGGAGFDLDQAFGDWLPASRR